MKRMLAHERAADRVLQKARTWRLFTYLTMRQESRALAAAIDEFEILYKSYLEDLPQASDSSDA